MRKLVNSTLLSLISLKFFACCTLLLLVAVVVEGIVPGRANAGSQMAYSFSRVSTGSFTGVSPVSTPASPSKETAVTLTITAGTSPIAKPGQPYHLSFLLTNHTDHLIKIDHLEGGITSWLLDVVVRAQRWILGDVGVHPSFVNVGSGFVVNPKSTYSGEITVPAEQIPTVSEAGLRWGTRGLEIRAVLANPVSLGANGSIQHVSAFSLVTVAPPGDVKINRTPFTVVSTWPSPPITLISSLATNPLLTWIRDPENVEFDGKKSPWGSAQFNFLPAGDLDLGALAHGGASEIAKKQLVLTKQLAEELHKKNPDLAKPNVFAFIDSKIDIPLAKLLVDNASLLKTIVLCPGDLSPRGLINYPLSSNTILRALEPHRVHDIHVISPDVNLSSALYGQVFPSPVTGNTNTGDAGTTTSAGKDFSAGGSSSFNGSSGDSSSSVAGSRPSTNALNLLNPWQQRQLVIAETAIHAQALPNLVRPIVATVPRNRILTLGAQLAIQDLAKAPWILPQSLAQVVEGPADSLAVADLVKPQDGTRLQGAKDVHGSQDSYAGRDSRDAQSAVAGDTLSGQDMPGGQGEDEGEQGAQHGNQQMSTLHRRQNVPSLLVDNAELNKEQVAQVLNDMAKVNVVAETTSSPSMFLEPYWRQAQQILSVKAKYQIKRRDQELQALDSRAQKTANSITVVPSSRINLLATSANLPVHVENALNENIHIRVRLHSSEPRLVVKGLPSVKVAPHSTTTVTVPVSAVGAGQVELVAYVLNDGSKIVAQSSPIQVQVRAEWETRGLWIMVGVLGVLFLAGLGRAVRKGRRFPVKKS